MLQPNVLPPKLAKQVMQSLFAILAIKAEGEKSLEESAIQHITEEFGLPKAQVQANMEKLSELVVDPGNNNSLRPVEELQDLAREAAGLGAGPEEAGDDVDDP